MAATDSANRRRSDANDSAAAVDSADAAGPRPIFGTTLPNGDDLQRAVQPRTPSPTARSSRSSAPSSYSATTSTLSLTSGSPNNPTMDRPAPCVDELHHQRASAHRQLPAVTAASPSAWRARPRHLRTTRDRCTSQVLPRIKFLLGIENGDWTEFVGPTASFSVATFYALQITVTGSSLSVSVNGNGRTPPITATGHTPSGRSVSARSPRG